MQERKRWSVILTVSQGNSAFDYQDSLNHNDNREKDEELVEAEEEAAVANKELQQAETTLSHAKSEMKSKRDELKSKHSHLIKAHLEPTWP